MASQNPPRSYDDATLDALEGRPGKFGKFSRPMIHILTGKGTQN
jgi:hypothetical protein